MRHTFASRIIEVSSSKCKNNKSTFLPWLKHFITHLAPNAFVLFNQSPVV